jgi:hypothetical protein
MQFPVFVEDGHSATATDLDSAERYVTCVDVSGRFGWALCAFRVALGLPLPVKESLVPLCSEPSVIAQPVDDPAHAATRCCLDVD